MDIPTLRQIASAKFAEAVCDLEDEDDCRNLVETLLTFPPAYLKRVIPEMPFNGLKCLMQSGQFDNYLTSDAMNESVQREENRLRQLYAKRPDHKSVRSLTAGLVDIFGTTPFNNTNADLFKLRKWGKDFFESGRTSDSKADEDASNGDTEDVPEARETESMNTNKDTKVESQEGETKESVVSKKKSTNKRPKRMIMFSQLNIPSVASTGQPSIVSSLSEFRKNFNCFTSNALLELDWTNVLAAGGACTACLLPVDSESRRGAWFNPEIPWNTKRWRENAAQSGSSGSNVSRMYTQDDIAKFGKRSRSHKSRDIDLFLYGLDAEQAKAKIQEIHAAITETSHRPPLVIVNGHAVTFYREFPNRSIQVITRLYKSPSEVLLGFDVDSCCVGFDGERVLCAPRTVRAFNTRCNFVDMSRRSLSYESRLFKYAKRNFACIIPDIERSEINPNVSDLATISRPYNLKGMQKLLMHEQSFNDFREPNCNCLNMLRGLKEETDDGLIHQYGPSWHDANHVLNCCLDAKLKVSLKDPTEGNRCGLPVSVRDVFIHSSNSSWWYNISNTKLYSLVGPSIADENKDLKKMNNSTSDYEYIVLPWKKGISMEQCHDVLCHHKNQHESSVAEKQFNLDDGHLPDFLECVDPSIPVCYFDFDVKKYLHCIQFVERDAGRQLLTGSFHPVDNENWYDNVKLPIGIHKRFQIVLEKIDYPENVSMAAKLLSSMVVRKAILESIYSFDTTDQHHNKNWILNNGRSYVQGHGHVDKPPNWWQGKVVLASAATLEQVESFKLSIAIASPAPFEVISFNEYEIAVGENYNSKVSLALAMAQPALNRCDYCSSELLVPNRCRGCKKVSFCNKKCQQHGWPKHRNVCAAGKKRKKKKKQPESRSTKA